MTTNFSSKDQKLSDLMEGIDKDSIQLPDFQRGWVWSDTKIKSLLASLCQSFPIGVIMELQYDAESTGFKNRSFHNSTVSVKPDFLVLDGQQRLTSIYKSVFSKDPVKTKNDRDDSIERYYYIDIKKSLTDISDVEDAIFSIPEDRVIRENFDRDIKLDLSSPEKEYQNYCFPMNIMFDRKACSQWRNEYQKYHKYDPECLDEFTAFETSIIETVYSYMIPVITISKEMPRGAVCQIFEKVNTGGVVLNVFELLTAIYASEGYHLRDVWDEVYKELSDYDLLKDVENTDFLTAVTLVTRFDLSIRSVGTVSCKRADILKMSLSDFKRRYTDVKEGFKSAAVLLDEFHIISRNDIPYKSQLIPLSAILTILDKKIEEKPIKELVKRWYWCGVFGELYGGSNDTRYVNDLMGILKWVEGGEEPVTVKRSFFSATRLLSIKTRNSAAYKGVMALVISNGAKDPMSGTPISLKNYYAQAIDIHHIFPKQYCINQGYPQEKYDCVLNKTPISRLTNEIIGSRAPSKYLLKLERERQLKPEELDDLFKGHLANPDYMRSDSFDDFITDRATSIIKMIEDATGKEITDKNSEKIIEKFGKPLVKEESEPNDQ